MLEKGQSCLEKSGIVERHDEIIRNKYNNVDAYSATHQDAVSDGDVQGKGTLSGGHGASLPDCSLKGIIDYSNFNTQSGGGFYDIEGRNDIGGRKKAMASLLYGPENPYGANRVITMMNQKDGQITL